MQQLGSFVSEEKQTFKHLSELLGNAGIPVTSDTSENFEGRRSANPTFNRGNLPPRTPRKRKPEHEVEAIFDYQSTIFEVENSPSSSEINLRAANTFDASRALKPASSTPRQHVKVSADLAQQMRDAVWFLCENGRPRVKLNEVLDEALELWLDRMRAEHMAGQRFPHRGSLK